MRIRDDHSITWHVAGVSPEAVLHWSREIADGAGHTSVILTRAGDDGPVTMDGRATLLHHDVTDVGVFTVVLWGDRPDKRGGDYVIRQHIPAPPAPTLNAEGAPDRQDPPAPPCGVMSRKLGATVSDLRRLGYLDATGQVKGRKPPRPPKPWHRVCVCALGHDGQWHRSEDGQVWHDTDSVTRAQVAEEEAELRRQMSALDDMTFVPLHDDPEGTR